MNKTFLCPTSRTRLLVIVLATLVGCAAKTNAPKKATDIDSAQATPYYWISKPAVASAESVDFDRLWNACRDEVRLRTFLIDREDFRGGVLTSQPLTSEQFWEVWRRDADTYSDLADSSLATIRRTIRFELVREDDGHFRATPKVLVERYASAERRLTSITQYHTAFSAPRPTSESDGNPTAGLPTDYWYAVGRDPALERDLAACVQRRVAGGSNLRSYVLRGG